MFTADHQRAANELLRVCRRGVIGLANWTPAGFVGQMLKLVGRHVPPPPGARPPTRWGTEGGVRELLGTGASELPFTTTADVRLRVAPTAHAATAPRGALLYPRPSREGLEGRFLGLMADLYGKPEGDNSMPGK
jgi:hypothetical protein